MTSSDQPLSNSPKCETCGLDAGACERMQVSDREHADGLGIHPHPFEPAPLSNSEGDEEEMPPEEDETIDDLWFEYEQLLAERYQGRGGGNTWDNIAKTVVARDRITRAIEAASRLSAIAPSDSRIAELEAEVARLSRTDERILIGYETGHASALAEMAPLVREAEDDASTCEFLPDRNTWCLTHAEQRPCRGDRIRAALPATPTPIPSADSESQS